MPERRGWHPHVARAPRGDRAREGTGQELSSVLGANAGRMRGEVGGGLRPKMSSDSDRRHPRA